MDFACIAAIVRSLLCRHAEIQTVASVIHIPLESLWGPVVAADLLSIVIDVF